MSAVLAPCPRCGSVACYIANGPVCRHTRERRPIQGMAPLDVAPRTQDVETPPVDRQIKRWGRKDMKRGA